MTFYKLIKLGSIIISFVETTRMSYLALKFHYLPASLRPIFLVPFPLVLSSCCRLSFISIAVVHCSFILVANISKPSHRNLEK